MIPFAPSFSGVSMPNAPSAKIGMAVIAVQVESGRSGNGIISRRFEDSNLAYMYGGRSIGLSVEGEYA
jgi:hypothetical protein